MILTIAAISYGIHIMPLVINSLKGEKTHRNTYGTDLMEHHTRERHALESNPQSTKMSSIHHQVQVDAVVKCVQRKDLQ